MSFDQRQQVVFFSCRVLAFVCTRIYMWGGLDCHAIDCCWAVKLELTDCATADKMSCSVAVYSICPLPGGLSYCVRPVSWLFKLKVPFEAKPLCTGLHPVMVFDRRRVDVQVGGGRQASLAVATVANVPTSRSEGGALVVLPLAP